MIQYGKIAVAALTISIAGCASTATTATNNTIANTTFKTPSLCTNNIGQNSGVTPIVRIEPKYPIKAARAGVGGYVIMDFDVTATGKTANIRVIESHPADLFNSAAKASLSKWRYKPAVENGQAVSANCLNVRLDFRLG